MRLVPTSISKAAKRPEFAAGSNSRKCHLTQFNRKQSNDEKNANDKKPSANDLWPRANFFIIFKDRKNWPQSRAPLKVDLWWHGPICARLSDLKFIATRGRSRRQ